MKSNSHNSSSVDLCRIIDIPRHIHRYGTIAVAQNSNDIPFAIKRIFYIYDIPSDAERGGHSHHTGLQFIIAVSGCFDVTVFDGVVWKTFTLMRPYQGLYIPAGIWRTLHNFSSGSICLTLCSNDFDESDYVKHFDDFMELTKNKSLK